ncbi:hypothetical protein ACFQZZ_17090 [Nocardia sp. GCM10030253]|uniref:hypothetical protein n=1 Tax=Nocardia sp. GCM10030253 TaxID=3273404 RepID=UPI0036404AA9
MVVVGAGADEVVTAVVVAGASVTADVVAVVVVVGAGGSVAADVVVVGRIGSGHF